MTINAVRGNLWWHEIVIRPIRFNSENLYCLQKILIEFTHSSQSYVIIIILKKKRGTYS